MDPNKYPAQKPPETAQQPNYFEGMSSTREVLPEYERLLGGAIDEYVNEPARTSEFVQGISTRIESIMSTAGAILPGMLDDRSKAILESSGRYDVRSRHIPGLFAGAYPEMQPALNIIRDAGLLIKAREAVAKSNPHSRLVVETVGKGATPIARDAMQIVVNADELAKQRIAPERSQQTQGARTEQSRSRAGFNPESAIFADGGIFGGHTGKLVWEALYGKAAQAGSPRDDAGGSASPHASHTTGSRSQQSAESVAPHREVEVDDTVAIISKAVATNKQYAWLQSDPDAVKQVVKAVREGRSEGLTDEKIYRKYRLGAERGDDAAMEKVKVLDALQDGPKGTLPF